MINIIWFGLLFIGIVVGIATGNVKVFLYHVAHLHTGCVLGTDQLDELLTGFWTLHGDAGDVSLTVSEP